MNTLDIESLKNIIREAVRASVLETLAERSKFPLSTSRQVAKLFGLSVWSVRDLAKKRLLKAHYQKLSGRTSRLVFTNRDLVDFFDQNFPSYDDVHSPGRPGNLKAIEVAKILSLNKLYHRRRQPK